MSAFFDLVAQDPVVSQAKLIAEPWDVGQMDSYDLGRFPRAVARVERQVPGQHAGLLAQPGDRRHRRVRHPVRRLVRPVRGGDGARRRASVNLITVHDGFTLRDLVSYDSKHNEANGESNRDGTDDNRSWNCGAEGPTTDPEVLALRARQSRAMLTTLLLSFGVPMLLGGDELGRTQNGNNNAYCQDNEISWVDWSAVDTGLLAFARSLVAFRRSHPVFRRRRFLTGAEATELGWFTPAGTPMTPATGPTGNALALGVYLDGSDDPDLAADGQPAARRRLPGPGERVVGAAGVHHPGGPGRAGVAARRSTATTRPLWLGQVRLGQVRLGARPGWGTAAAGPAGYGRTPVGMCTTGPTSRACGVR